MEHSVIQNVKKTPKLAVLKRSRVHEALREDVLEEVFGPDDAVDGFRGSVADGAARESLLCGFGLTLVALCRPLQARKRNTESKMLYRAQPLTQVNYLIK